MKKIIKNKKNIVLNKSAVLLMQTLCNFELNKSKLELARKRFENFCKAYPKPRVKNINNNIIGSIPTRTYSNGNDKHTMVFIHGGGYVLGSVESHDILCRRISKYCNIKVISIEYSLAPEKKFPFQLDEVRSVLNELTKDISARYILCGDSAGGGIAAALSHEYKNISELVLFYPLLDATLRNESVKINGIDKNFLTAEMLRWFIEQYTTKDQNLQNPMLSPLYASATIPTFLAAGKRDPLFDDSEKYEEKLLEAGIPHIFCVLPHAMHGFMQFPKRFGYRDVLYELNIFLNTISIENN